MTGSFKEDPVSMAAPSKRSNRPIIIVAIVLALAGLCWVLVGNDDPVVKSVPTVAKAPVAAPQPVVPAPKIEIVRTEEPAPADKVKRPVRTPDSVVLPSFVNDLAAFIVDGYQPGPKGKGRLTVGVHEVNMHCGVRMKGLKYSGKDLETGRRAVLKYVLRPRMVESLYGLYADDLMTAVARHVDRAKCRGAGWSAATRRDFYSRYAALFSRTSSTLRGIHGLSAKGVASKVQRIHDLGGKVVAAENRYGELMASRHLALDTGKKAKAASLKPQVSAAAKGYQEALIARENAKRSLCTQIEGKADGRILGEDSVLYLAQWVDRRVREDGRQFAAVEMGAACMKDLADRFAAKAAK